MNARERDYAVLRATMPRPLVRIAAVDAFHERFVAQKGYCARLASVADIPAYILQHLPDADAFQCSDDPLLQQIDWPSAGLNASPATTRPLCALAITTALCAVAETGSLAVCSGSAAPLALNFLPDRVLIVVSETDIVANLEDFWARVRERFGHGLPRALCLVSGPSTSGDVEMHFATGVHGPIEAHALIIP